MVVPVLNTVRLYRCAKRSATTPSCRGRTVNRNDRRVAVRTSLHLGSAFELRSYQAIKRLYTPSGRQMRFTARDAWCKNHVRIDCYMAPTCAGTIYTIRTMITEVIFDIETKRLFSGEK